MLFRPLTAAATSAPHLLAHHAACACRPCYSTHHKHNAQPCDLCPILAAHTTQAAADIGEHTWQAADAEGVPSDAELEQATRKVLGALPDLLTFSVNDLLAGLGAALLSVLLAERARGEESAQPYIHAYACSGEAMLQLGNTALLCPWAGQQAAASCAVMPRWVYVSSNEPAT